jgi:hypothetical protein
MRYIKLFESFDDENHISKSIRDILIELEDEGMQVIIEYQPESFKYDRPSYALEEPKKTIIQPGVTIEIKGKPVNGYPYMMQQEFEVSSVRDYIDTVVDFIEDIWPSYDLYFEKYDIDDAHIQDGKVLKDGKCGSIVIQIHKREI